MICEPISLSCYNNQTMPNSPTALSNYNYVLPKDRIATQPPTERGASRLLTLNRETGELADKRYADLPELLQAGDVVVINDTRVIPARLAGKGVDGRDVELLLLERHGRDFGGHEAVVMYRGQLAVGEQITVATSTVTIRELLGGGIARVSSDQPLLKLAETAGAVPLPPYMKRAATAADRERYQTVFAREQGSVAAPTASLNLTEAILDRLRAKGVIVAQLTLHVGLGTFLPIRSDNLAGHQMHEEYYQIPAETVEIIKTARADGRRVVAIGTTVARTLEYAADDIASAKPQTDLSGEADIFIYPGYTFKLVGALVTNFHAPKSTVLMLTAAWAGWGHLKAAYEHAIAEEYQFLSYGDSMVIY
jgi:S-adenosylmethionine:tRNA ribosyltransferase-isomerase